MFTPKVCKRLGPVIKKLIHAFYFIHLFLIKQRYCEPVTCNRANLQVNVRQLISEKILLKCLKWHPVSQEQTDDLYSHGTELEEIMVANKKCTATNQKGASV